MSGSICPICFGEDGFHLEFMGKLCPRATAAVIKENGRAAFKDWHEREENRRREIADLEELWKLSP